MLCTTGNILYILKYVVRSIEGHSLVSPNTKMITTNILSIDVILYDKYVEGRKYKYLPYNSHFNN